MNILHSNGKNDNFGNTGHDHDDDDDDLKKEQFVTPAPLSNESQPPSNVFTVTSSSSIVDNVKDLTTIMEHDQLTGSNDIESSGQMIAETTTVSVNSSKRTHRQHRSSSGRGRRAKRSRYSSSSSSSDDDDESSSDSTTSEDPSTESENDLRNNKDETSDQVDRSSGYRATNNHRSKRISSSSRLSSRQTHHWHHHSNSSSNKSNVNRFEEMSPNYSRSDYLSSRNDTDYRRLDSQQNNKLSGSLLEPSSSTAYGSSSKNHHHHHHHNSSNRYSRHRQQQQSYRHSSSRGYRSSASRHVDSSSITQLPKLNQSVLPSGQNNANENNSSDFVEENDPTVDQRKLSSSLVDQQQSLRQHMPTSSLPATTSQLVASIGDYYAAEPYNPEDPGMGHGQLSTSMLLFSRGFPPNNNNLGDTFSRLMMNQNQNNLLNVCSNNQQLQRRRQLVSVPVSNDNNVYENSKMEIGNGKRALSETALQINKDKRRKNKNTGTTTLLVKKIPVNLNRIDALSAYFSKFGHLINITTGPDGDPGAALVTFSNHIEAAKAIRCVEPVLNNRFIHVYWANNNNSNQTKKQQEDSSKLSTTAPHSFQKTSVANKAAPPTINVNEACPSFSIRKGVIHKSLPSMMTSKRFVKPPSSLMRRKEYLSRQGNHQANQSSSHRLLDELLVNQKMLMNKLNRYKANEKLASQIKRLLKANVEAFEETKAKILEQAESKAAACHKSEQQSTSKLLVEKETINPDRDCQSEMINLTPPSSSLPLAQKMVDDVGEESIEDDLDKIVGVLNEEEEDEDL